MRRALLFCGLVSVSCAGAAALPRLGVGGGQRVGFAGALLRAGLPFDYLSDTEQADVTALRRYDLLLMSTVSRFWEPWAPDCAAAVEQYLRGGGRALVELGLRLPGWPPGELRGEWPWPPKDQLHDFALTAALGRLPAGTNWPYSGTLHWPVVEPTDTQVLARYRHGREAGRPAILAKRLGLGELIALGPELSYQQGNWQPAYEELILAAVERLTDGRAKRQWAVPAESSDPAKAEADPPGPTAEAPVPAGWTKLGEAPRDGYMLRLTGPARLWLDHGGSGGAQAALTAGRFACGSHSAPLPGDARLVVVYRSSGRVRVFADGVQAAAWEQPGEPGGAVLASDGADQVLCQPLETVHFEDDFTRAGPLQAPWQTRGGPWLTGGTHRNESPIPGFALRAWPGTATAGEWFWSDYDCGVSLRPRGAKTVRLQLARWSDGDLVEAILPVEHGGVRVQRVKHGVVTKLGDAKGHLSEQQWTRVVLGCRAGRVTLSGDGARWLDVPAPDVGPGGIGLVVEGGDCLVDDVAVHGGPPELPVIHSPRFDKGREGMLDRDTWSHPAAAWEPDREQAGRFWHVGLLAGDFQFTVPLPAAASDATLTVWLDDGQAVKPSWVAPANGVVTITRHQSCVTARFVGPGSRGFRSGHSSLPIVSLDAMQWFSEKPLRLGLECRGLTLAPADLELRAAEVDEWQFDRALTTVWETAGDWLVGSRWPCMPEWSWLQGSGDPVAAVWTKSPLLGDAVVHALLGVRMQGKYGEHEGEPFERLRLSLCGDGHGPRSGYWLDLGGGPDGATRLYRRETVVASCPRHLTYPREAHNFWADVRFERHGARLDAFCQHRPLLSWTDPQPLPDGQVCLWAERNALMTPYVAVYGRHGPPRPVAGGVQRQRRDARGRHLARPAFDLLPALHALGRICGWEAAS